MVFLSDPQFHRIGSQIGLDAQSREHNTDLVAGVNSLNTVLPSGFGPPAAAVINGDLTEYWNGDEADDFHTIYGGLNVPQLNGLGNHDYQNNADDCGPVDLPNSCAEAAIYDMANSIIDLEEDPPTGIKLVSRDWPDRVWVRNDADVTVLGMVIQFDLAGQGRIEHSDQTDFSAGQTRGLSVPEEATNLELQVDVAGGSDETITFAALDPRTCLQLTGSINLTNLTVKQTSDCSSDWPDDPSDYPNTVNFTNNSGPNNRFVLEWDQASGANTIDLLSTGRTTDDTGVAGLGGSATTAYPSDATTLEAGIIGIDNGSRWQTAAVPTGGGQYCLNTSGPIDNVQLTGPPSSCTGNFVRGPDGSLSYAFELDEVPGYRFIQLHNRPDWFRNYTTAHVLITQSYDWLRQEALRATAEHKKIVVNLHDYPESGSAFDMFVAALQDTSTVAVFAGHVHEQLGWTDRIPTGVSTYEVILDKPGDVYDGDDIGIPVYHSGAAHCRSGLAASFRNGATAGVGSMDVVAFGVSTAGVPDLAELDTDTGSYNACGMNYFSSGDAGGLRRFELRLKDEFAPVWTCNGIPATIVGTPGSETIEGTAGADVIAAREGDDTIRGLGGDDIICAGKGNDTIYGGLGFDIIFGAQGNDVLFSKNGATTYQRSDSRGARMFGGLGNDQIHGSNRWDRMQGGPGNDVLIGYEGRDWLRAGPGNDAVDGGPGIDDQHGGNGPDTIDMTNGDTVRGGAGLDLCRIAWGQPVLLVSCGTNVRES